MQTFGVKVFPQEKVTKSKRNGNWRVRYRVLVPEGLTREDVNSILKPYINSRYKISVISPIPSKEGWSSEITVTLQDIKAILRNLELFYYKQQNKIVYNNKWAKIADVKISPCFDVHLEERLHEGWRIVFFHIESLAKDIKHIPDVLIEDLTNQDVECRLSENKCPYVFTIEKAVNTNHFRLIKVKDGIYSLDKLYVDFSYVTETVKVLF